jgi:hypothetical protein
MIEGCLGEEILEWSGTRQEEAKSIILLNNKSGRRAEPEFLSRNILAVRAV